MMSRRAPVFTFTHPSLPPLNLAMDNHASRIRPRSNSADFEEGPPLQRQKLHCSISGTEEASCNGASTSIVVATKDEKYYRDDGDCIIQVEDVLFKIHRYHLTEDSDSSVFHTMFCMPPGQAPSEGQHDCNPISLSEDSLVQFRAFLSFSYST
ncbi:hypothetical protein K438DRAFT_18071 [Mycena galopus ATCC 62051]|nr:hypothetical protein K438DRAFT_18071 [Mycena galopus ATCC 62051]